MKKKIVEREIRYHINGTLVDEYRELLLYAIDNDTKEDVCIRNSKIIVEEGVITKIMASL